MKFFKPTLTAMTIAAALSAPPTASAGPTVGLDITGTGNYTTYADLWTNVTDTGLATGFIPGLFQRTPRSAFFLTAFFTMIAKA